MHLPAESDPGIELQAADMLLPGIVLICPLSIEDMKAMFLNCSKLTSLNLSSFDTSGVTTMDRMFYKCSNLKTINLSSFK